MASRWTWSARRAARWIHPRDLRRNVTIQRGIATRGLEPVGTVSQVRNAATSMKRELPVDGPIWAITMVRDEEDIIEESIVHLLRQGVDRVLVADNLSNDRTRPILESLGRTLPVHVTSDPIHPYWQGEKMSLLARAATRFGASWIVPFDADELWHGLDGTVRETLH